METVLYSRTGVIPRPQKASKIELIKPYKLVYSQKGVRGSSKTENLHRQLLEHVSQAASEHTHRHPIEHAIHRKPGTVSFAKITAIASGSTGQLSGCSFALVAKPTLWRVERVERLNSRHWAPIVFRTAGVFLPSHSSNSTTSVSKASSLVRAQRNFGAPGFRTSLTERNEAAGCLEPKCRGTGSSLQAP